MDRFEKQLKDLNKAIKRLEEALTMATDNRDNNLYSFLRDSSIQRFEFTFEIFWKFVKTALKQLEGIECNSPKSCMRELFRNKYIEEYELEELLKMVDDRNLTVHTYREEIAEDLFNKLKKYINLIKTVIARISEKYKSF